MKNFLSFFIKYPVAVNVIMFSVAIFGYLGLQETKSSFFPLDDSKLIFINIVYPGASPTEIEEGVVLKIEDNLRGLVDIDRVTSTSQENTATISVEIEEGADIDIVLANVKNAVDRVPSFPVDMEPPVISKQENINPAITFTISGGGVPLKTLKDAARKVEDDIRTIPNISQVALSGFPDEEIEIAVRENDLRAFNLTFAEVAAAVRNSNLITTGGNIKTDTEEYLIRASNRSYFGSELDFIIVKASSSGQVIRLKDVAEVRDRWSEVPDRINFNGNSAVQISVSTTNNEDLLYATDKIKEYIIGFNNKNDVLKLSISNDSSIALNARQKLLVDNGIIGIILVLVFLSIFLKPSIAFWVAIGLPFSFLGLFIFAPSFMTINVISLFGMIIVIGILVDDGIVIAENIYDQYEKGKSRVQAAIDGTMQVFPPIMAAILTTVIAFSTFIFLPERIGSFFGQIAKVVGIILLISLVEAFLILPAHLAHSRALDKKAKPFILNVWADKVISWVRDNLYVPMLRFFLNYKIFGFAIPVAMLLLTVGAMQGGIIRFTFFPNIASDRIAINLKMPQGTSEDITDSLITMIEELAWEANKELTKNQTGNLSVIENSVRRIGPGSSNASLTLNLLPGEKRDVPSAVVSKAIRELVGPIYDAESVVFGAGNQFGGKPVSVSLVGNNIAELKQAKQDLKTAFRENPRMADVTDNDPAGIKEINIQLKENAYLLGLTLNAVMSQVRSGFFGAAVQRFQRGRDEIRVWVRYDVNNRSSITDLDEMRIVTPTGNRVPLAEIASYKIQRGDVVINHLDGRREIRVEADLSDSKDSAPEVLGVIRSSIMPEIMAKYPTVTPLYEGQNRGFSKIEETMMKVLPIILILMYAVIAFVFRSYGQPLLLFILIPFCFVGVAWGHWFHGQSINVLSGLGIVALIGILVNDGLVLIEKFNLLLKEGMPYRKAMVQAGRSRFRAIFLTSLTTVAGLAPLIFEKSFSAQFLIPMAISVAYGIAYATFMTLFLLPLLLAMKNSFKVGIQWLWTGRKPEPEEVERAILELKSEKL
ncbi:MAG: efflux RND transporter permease subunit [Saprospiraceae bacterium]|jgi:multidrug efflux pump subunit AcrB|nr:efflux RND transporter permease subunit [Saprospiraceae bacterium]